MSESIKIILTGDIFLADSPLRLGRGVKSLINNVGIGYLSARAKKITQGNDIVFGNLECVLSLVGVNPFNIATVEVRGNPCSVKDLKECGFNILNIANNHIFQHGPGPYFDTLNLLTDNGIKFVGNETDHGSNFERFCLKGNDIGFVGYSLHYEQYRPDEEIPYSLRNNYEEILSEVKNIRAEFEGYLICSLHWGYEFMNSISSDQKRFCHSLVDAGVDLIVGHHPHVAQGYEKYKDSLIFYSLGNFIFDMENEETDKSFAVKVEVAESLLNGFEIVPYEIKDDFCPHPLVSTIKDEYIAEIVRMSDEITTGALSSPAEMEILEKKKYSVIKKKSYNSFFKNFMTTNIYYNFCIVVRALLRRVGVLNTP